MTNWREMTRAEISANPVRYWRLKYLEQRRAWPAHTKLELTEYGFLRKCRARPTLARLASAERRIDNDVRRGALFAAMTAPKFDLRAYTNALLGFPTVGEAA